MPATSDAFAALRPLVPAVLLASLVVALLVALSPSAHGSRTHATRWDCLSHHEATHRWHVNTGNGHYGGLQFSRSTWAYYGGQAHSGNYWPHQATKREQIVVAKRVAFTGWKGRRPQGGRSAWPNTWPQC